MNNDEKRVVDSIIAIIKYRQNQECHIVSEPDKVNRSTRDVECILMSGDICLAIEHTRCESFIDQTSMEMEMKSIRGEIEHELCGKLPEDKLFTLLLPIDLTRRLNRKKQKVVIAEVKEWIIKETPTMTCKETKIKKFEDDNLIFKIFSQKSTLNMNGKLHTNLCVKELSEDDRKKRIKKIFDDKLPKLYKYKDNQFTTILAIEDIDIFLSNLQFCENAIDKLRDNFNGLLPDYIYYFTTYDNRIMDGWIIKEGNKFVNDIPMRGPFYNLPHRITLD